MFIESVPADIIPASQHSIPAQPGRIRLQKFITCFAIGGTERQFLNLGKALDPCLFELHLACLGRRGDLLTELEASGIPVSEYKIKSLYRPGTFKEQFRFAESLRRRRIQILHTYGFYPNVFAIPSARLAGVPIILASIRDTGEVWTPLQRRVQKLVCRLADRIVVNAEAIRQRLIAEGYCQEQITVIPIGIACSRIKSNRNGAGLRRELGLPSHCPLVVVLSRLTRTKGLEHFLEAAAIVAARVPTARFLIVGDVAPVDGDAYKQELERYVFRLGVGQRVVFTGFRLDVSEVLAEASVSVLPSLSEGLSNVLLESMAAGVPVVATRVGGNPEAVEEDVTGLLVPPRDPAALAEAICRLLDNHGLASRFVQAGRQRVVERFSLERMVQETERLYLKLLNGSRLRVAGARGGTQVRGSSHGMREPN